MADEIVYADLNLPETRLAKSVQSRNFHSCPRWHRIALRVGGAGHIVLLLVVVVLSVWVIHSRTTKPQTASETCISEAATQGPGNGSDCHASLENMVLCLKDHVCQPEHEKSENESIDPSSENECKLCPRDWLPHGKKCYKFFDKMYKTWNESKEECAKRGAQMLMLHDKKEKAYTENMPKQKNPIWIGLQFNLMENKWMWVDGSPLLENQFSGPTAAERQQCGTIKESQFGSEFCTAQLTWICQKEALII